MLAPLRALSLLALVTLMGVSANTRDVSTFFLPELLPPLTQPAEHQLVTQQLAALGITRFVPPTAEETKETNLWSLLTANHQQIGLVWSAGDVAPPLDALSFPSTFRTKINVVPGSQLRLTDGDAFYQHIRENQHQKEKFNFNFVPNYLVLPRDQSEMPKVFAAAVKRVEFEMKREDDAAIYQRFLVRELPKNGNDNALPTASVISSNEELQAKLTGELAGKTVEVTQYVEPYLIDGHKFQVGFYVAITSIDPLRVYYYSHPQIKIAKTAYPSRLDTKSPRSAYNFDEYIAPWDFPDLQKLYYEFPSADRTGTNSWNVVKRYMMMQGQDTTRLQQQIDAAIASSIVSSRGFFQSQITKLKRSAATGDDQSELEESFFQLLRFDMEVDDSGKPWLTRIHANPSLAPTQGVVGTDAAIKTNVVRDLLHLVGVPSQSKPSFDAFFKPPSSSKQPSHCAQKCQDNSRTWDATCWSCPGWFTPSVSQRLFGSVSEYARRGGFKLVFPSLDGEYTKFLDNTLSQHDQALSRYIKSLSQASAETQPDESVVSNNRVVTCVYREHCSGNGDCVNGKCMCDDEYEGATCYVPKDQAREKRMKLEAKEGAATKEDGGGGGGWNLWNREPAAPQAKDRTTAKGGDDGARIPEDAAAENGGGQQLHAQDQGAGGGVSGASVLTSVVFVGIFMYVGYQVYVAYVGSSDAYKKN